MHKMTRFLTLDVGNIDSVASLYARVFNGPPWNDGWTRESAAERLRSFAGSADFRGLASLDDHDEPIAVALGHGERWTDGWVFYLKEMYVAPELQGQGRGRALLEAFEQRLLEAGLTRVFLQTAAKAPATVFYQRLGYEPLPLVSMRKRLTAG